MRQRMGKTLMPKYTFNIIATEYGVITVEADNEEKARELIDEEEGNGKAYWKNRDVIIEKLIETK